MREPWLVIGFLGLLASCSGDDEKSPLTRGEFCSNWGENACSEETVSVCQATDVDACRASQESFCLELVPRDFVPDQADACLKAVTAAYKDGDLEDDELEIVLRLGGPCDKLVSGPRAEGESCEATSDCDAAHDFECIFKADEAAGSCQLPNEIEAGFDCSKPEDVCEAGFYCDGENCLARKVSGRACTKDMECQEELYCTEDGQCTERLLVSETCTADAQCATGICYAATSEDEATCTDRIRLSRAEPVCDDLR